MASQTLGPDRFEVVVVDDGSQDGTAQLLDSRMQGGGLPLRAIQGPAAGPAAARNRGWRAARADIIAFTDDDCEPPPDWLEQVLAEAARHPGEIIQGPTTPIPHEVGDIGPFSRTNEITKPSASYETCNIAYPRDLLERLGGFDEIFPDALGEDTDLGWRARALGASLHWSDRVRMHHAVDYLGPIGFLRTALRGADAVLVFRRHPRLRQEIRWGVVRHAGTPGLAVAVLGFGLARRSRLLGSLLLLPYVRHLARTCARQRASLVLAPYYALWDILFLVTALRGSIRHRTLVL